MRALPLILTLLVALNGCRSSRGVRPKHDYSSVNRSSRAFLRDTLRSGRRLRRQNLRTALQFKRRAKESRYQRRNGLRFARESFFGGMISESKLMLEGVKRELSGTDFRQNVRFGFLDGGD